MWPPTLADFKQDQKISDDDYDASYQQALDAAVVVVERVRSDLNYTGDELDPRPQPGADVYLGTIRLAGRWYQRRDTPQGLMQMSDLGVLRIASFDPDIERLLRIGKYRKNVIA